jgi:serine/threonine protein phosphatase PrpC
MSSLGPAPAPRERGNSQNVGRTLLSAGRTDAGRQREVNEDRLCLDADRGVFGVIDGVGGQAAGGRAADIALALIKETLGREAGPPADRLRAAITDANNEIYRSAATRAEWDGMACVLTVALVNNGTVTFGHVGDTRLYKLRADRIEKLTPDHSPVGEREDASEITERQAMRHPRRNEVYRDVGSEFHDRRDRDFIDIREVPFEPDAALLLCSDGLTDLVDSVTIARTVSQNVGHPEAVVRELIVAANAAGGKDNVTVVYVEGETFATSNYGRGPIQSRTVGESVEPEKAGSRGGGWPSWRVVGLSTPLLIGLTAALTLWSLGWTLDGLREAMTPSVFLPAAGQRTVAAGGSIAEAMRDAPAGTEIVVEPGEYREQVTLLSGVRLRSRVPRGATIRLPAGVRDAADVAAVTVRNVSGAEIVGFRISGDSATPLPVGLLVQDSTVSIVNVEITGATRAAIQFAGAGASTLMASDIRDNPGSALTVRDGGKPHISHNSFARNGNPDRGAAFVVRKASPTFTQNVFVGSTPAAFDTLEGAAETELRRDNFFVPAEQSAPRR